MSCLAAATSARRRGVYRGGGTRPARSRAPATPKRALNGGELAIVYCFVFLYFSVAGGRPRSLDRVRGMTPRWREMDSNSRSPVSGDTPQRPQIASPGIISAKSRLALRTKGFEPFAEILRALARRGHND